MLALFATGVVAAAACLVEPVAGHSGENHVFFDGVSPDGKTLAIGWDRKRGETVERGAYLLDLGSGARRDLPGLNNAPSFSPDGRFLVAANYAADRALRTEIVELDRRTGGTRSFASSASGEWLPSYSPDGRWILFNSTRSGGSDLYRVRRSDGLLQQLTRGPEYEAHAQALPGGARIIFHRQVAGNDYDLALLDIADGKMHAIAASPMEEAYPSISGDGEWIAFSGVANPGEQPNLYVTRADGSGRQRLTNGPDKDAYAGWSPDGRWLYFVRFAEKGAAIYRIGMKGGQCRTGKPTRPAAG